MYEYKNLGFIVMKVYVQKINGRGGMAVFKGSIMK